jgi:hypothetical protein
MSFRGLEFVRLWVKEHIYRPRASGSAPPSAAALAESLKREVQGARIELEEIEEEVGSVEAAIGKALNGRPVEEAK